MAIIGAFSQRDGNEGAEEDVEKEVTIEAGKVQEVVDEAEDFDEEAVARSCSLEKQFAKCLRVRRGLTYFATGRRHVGFARGEPFLAPEAAKPRNSAPLRPLRI